MIQSHVQHRAQPDPCCERVKGVTYFQHMISYDAFGLDKDLVDHGVTVITVHFMDAVLV